MVEIVAAVAVGGRKEDGTITNSIGYMTIANYENRGRSLPVTP